MKRKLFFSIITAIALIFLLALIPRIYYNFFCKDTYAIVLSSKHNENSISLKCLIVDSEYQQLRDRSGHRVNIDIDRSKLKDENFSFGDKIKAYSSKEILGMIQDTIKASKVEFIKKHSEIDSYIKEFYGNAPYTNVMADKPIAVINLNDNNTSFQMRYKNYTSNPDCMVLQIFDYENRVNPRYILLWQREKGGLVDILIDDTLNNNGIVTGTYHFFGLKEQKDGQVLYVSNDVKREYSKELCKIKKTMKGTPF